MGGGRGLICFIGEGSGEGAAVQKDSSRPCKSCLINAASSAIVYKEDALFALVWLVYITTRRRVTSSPPNELIQA